MHPARRCCSSALAALCVSSSSRRGPSSAARGRLCCSSSSSPATASGPPRHCRQHHGGTSGGGEEEEEGVSAGTTAPQVKKTGSSITTTAARPGPGSSSVCPMGSSSSSSRLFGTLAHQTLSSPPSDQPHHHLYPAPQQEEDADPDGLGEGLQADPDQLLRECERALQKRPARPHRDLVYPGGGRGQAHSHNNHDPGPSIRVLQWNILAQALGEGKDGFVRCPLDALNWQERKYLILEEIATHRPDVVCLQEVDHYFDTFLPVLSGLGYHGSFMAKPWSPCLDVARNNGPDGCALFYRRARFSLLATAHLRLAAMMLPTNQVAIVQTLRCRATQRQLCVAVTHLKARSGWERLRSAQGADLLQSLRSITAQAAANANANATADSSTAAGGAGAGGGSGVPLVVCGDFNAEPSEDVYRRFSSSPLGLASAYKLLSADGQTEPAYTTWKVRRAGESRGTLDYIWYTAGALRVDTLLDLPSDEAIGPDRLPSYHYPSDHISLLCDVSFTQPPTASAASHRLM